MAKAVSTIHIHTDGGARGNPGPAATGIVVEKVGQEGTKEVMREWGTYIGETTNNVAEYSAVVEALTWLSVEPGLCANGNDATTDVYFFLDSQLVVNQLNGSFQVKNSALRSLLFTIRNLEQTVGCSITYSYVPRALNAAADAMVNQALDRKSY